jgi:hypothetical protein
MRMPWVGEKPWRAEWRAILTWDSGESVIFDIVILLWLCSWCLVLVCGVWLRGLWPERDENSGRKPSGSGRRSAAPHNSITPNAIDGHHGFT